MSVIIRLKNLPMTAGSAEVRTFFSGLKIPDGAVHIIGGDEGEVFVGFASDEDARIAMMKNGKFIHNAEIRLFLSSKTEQNSVIQARKNGTYTSPKADDFSPTGSNPPIWPPQDPPSNPYAAQSGYEASYPPQNSGAPRPDFKNNANPNNYNSRPDHGRDRYPPPREPYHEPPREPYREPPRAKSPPRREKEDYGYNRNFHAPPPAHNKFGGGRGHEMEKMAPEVAPMREIPPPQADKFEMFTNRGPERNHAPPPADSWRTADFSKEPPPRNSFSPSKYPPLNGPPGNAPPPARKTLIPSANAPPPHHFQNGAPPQDELPPRNVPPPFHNAPPPRHPPSFNAPPPMIPPAINKPAVVPQATPAVTAEKFYIELTRLPNDLLRPAALEAFVHPSVPLTLSSVKTVYGPGGIHMHTIIRLDSIADYANMMRRNGEQGIKIVQSDKKTFDAAEDGPFAAVAPVAPVTAPAPAPAPEEPRRRSRWADEGSQKERSPLRRRTRSRSPYRKRRRSRSPRRRDQHTDPTRWCVQVTNVPFRMKEEELLEWFAEKVKPAKLTRTFYSDGNASDRWVAEFSSESLMRRAFAIRTLCQGRTLRTLYIDNDKADEIMKITDVYGMEKRQINEEARMLQENAEKANPPSFFNQPMMPRGAPIPPPQQMAPPPHQQPPPQRGNFQQRGGGGNFRGGMMGRGQPFFQNGPSSAFNGNSMNNNQDNGSFRGGFNQPPPFRGGRGGGRGGYGGFRDEGPSRNDFMDLIQSIGPRGTVLSCTGFPKDVTLEDVLCFFERYDPDRNSVRIRRGEDGVMTGECMLACFHQEDARQASKDLDGENFRNSKISVRCL